MPQECPHHEMISEGHRSACGKIKDLATQVRSCVDAKSLIAIGSIVVAVISLVTGMLHYGYATTIKELKDSDMYMARTSMEQARETNNALYNIQLSIARIEFDVKNLKEVKKDKGR
jgi:hypothetical protein